MSVEPNPPAGGDKRPAFTGRFPILAAETPAGQGSGERRPTFTAPASGPAEAVTEGTAPAGEGGQAADAAPPGDADAAPSGAGATGSGSGAGGSDPTGTKDGSPSVSSDAGADEGDRGRTASASGPTAALRPGIRSATSGAAGASVIAPAAKPTRGTGTAGPGTTGTAPAGAGTAAAPDSSRTEGPAGTPIAPGTADADSAAPADGTAAGSSASAQSAPTAVDVAGLDGSLLSDTVALRSNWERLQSGFVDDPEEAVADAAELVEQTVQALIAALRQRQRTLRELAKPGAKGTGGATDTEHLRRMMLRYRSLFNQLSRP